jgi:hypothetical protein
MDRVVTLVLMRSDGAVLGALPSFTVNTPWWPDVAEVVETCSALHGVDVTILRLLDAQPGPLHYRDDPLRARWARPAGPA